MLKIENPRVSEKKVPFIAKLGVGLGLALIITVICVTLKGSGGSSFEVKSLAKVSSSSEGFTFNVFGNRFMIPGNAPGLATKLPLVTSLYEPGYMFMKYLLAALVSCFCRWVYFWLLMAAGCGLFISEEALNIWVCALCWYFCFIV